MNERIGMTPLYALMNAVLALMSSRERLLMLIATLISEHKPDADGCLSVDDYARITDLQTAQVEGHLKILCESHLLKPVKSKVYDITESGRLALTALGVTDELVAEYKIGFAF